MIGFLDEGCAMIEISLKFVPRGLLDNNSNHTKYEYEMESAETATPIKGFSRIL